MSVRRPGRLWAVLLALPLLGAAPPKRGLSLHVSPQDSAFLPVPPAPPTLPRRGPNYEPAPLPNRDVDAPIGPRASTATSVAPSLFTRPDQYRGEGYSRGSSAQTEQERRLRPGAGFNLRMPLQSQ